jgi:ATP-dependent Clp protease ATP-binding subunit ClpC
MEDTSGVFERFTDRARRVVVLAQEEARMLDHNYIGTEHILLGLIHEGEGVAAQVLESLNVSLEVVRIQVEEIIGQGKVTPSGHIPFTPRAKKVLELSLREALQLHHNYIGTEHILLGLVREGEGVAAQVLQKLGADLNRVRQQVIQLLSGYTGGKGEGQPGERALSGSMTFESGERRSADITAALARHWTRLVRIQELAEEEAAALGADGSDPECLWLGSVRYDMEGLEVRMSKLEALLEEGRAKARKRQPPA